MISVIAENSIFINYTIFAKSSPMNFTLFWKLNINILWILLITVKKRSLSKIHVIYFILGVCLFGCLFEEIKTFSWCQLAWPQGRFMDAFKNLHLKISKFRKPWIEKDKSAKFLCYCMIITKEKMAQIE